MSRASCYAGCPGDQGGAGGRGIDERRAPEKGFLGPGHGTPAARVWRVEASAPRPRPYGRAIRVLFALAVLLAGVAVALPIVGDRPPRAGAAVLAAVSSTVGRRTSAVSIHGTVSERGVSVTMAGSGVVDYAAHEAYLDMSVPGARGVTVRELLVGGIIYEQIPGIGAVVPGKSWVSVDLASLGGYVGTAPTGGWGAATDPLAVVPLLEKEGGIVTALGPSTQDGQSVQGYRVRFGSRALAVQLSRADLPPGLRTAESALALDGMSVNLYVSAAGLLTSMKLQLRGVATSIAFSVALTMSFSTFGKTVTLSAPPAAQVLTLRQFVGAAGGDAGAVPAG